MSALRRIVFHESIQIDVVPYNRKGDVTRFTREAQHCPSCHGTEDVDNDTMSMEVGDWAIRWCPCGTVWADVEGDVVILADLAGVRDVEILAGLEEID